MGQYETPKQQSRRLTRSKEYDSYRDKCKPTYNQKCSLICCVLKFIETHSMLDVSREIDRYAKINRGHPDPDETMKELMDEDDLPF